MRVLITGPTSFTGSFFIEALSNAGHDVVTTFTQSVESYDGIRKLRAQKSALHATIHEGVCFGDSQFLALVKSESFDVFCHHGAWTDKYKSMDYDFELAFATNTRSMNKVCQLLSENGCRKVIVSGSIFEEATPIFSPYGLVKKLTTETIEFYGTQFGMHVSKFVIPNPFGPLDNPKLIDYLGREWRNERSAPLKVPPYVRDNIPVDLLALGFARWVNACPDTQGTSSFRPSGYVSTVSDFINRVSNEFRRRVSLDCAVEMMEMTDLFQPLTLVNTTPLQALFPEWDESAFWDDLVQFQLHLPSRVRSL